MSQAIPVPKSRRYALVLAAVVLLLGVFVGLRSAQKKAESLIRSKVDARGWGVHIETPTIHLTGKARIPEICISLEDDEHNDVCVEDLVLQLQHLALLRKRVRVQNLRAAHIQIDSSPERLAALRASADAHDDDDEEHDKKTVRGLPVIKRAAIDHMTIRLAHDDQAVDLRFEDLTVRTQQQDTSLRTRGYVHAFESENARLVQGLKPAMQKPFVVEAHADPDEGLQGASLVFDERVDLHIALRTALDISLDGVAFEAPYTLRVQGPDLRIADYELQLDATSIDADVGAWTRDLRIFYLSALRAESPHVSVSREGLSALKERIAPAKNDEDEDEAQADEAQAHNTNLAAQKNDADTDRAAVDDAPDTNTTPPPTSHSPIGALLQDFARERQWYEVLPRGMEFRDARVELFDNDANTSFQVQDLDLDYGVRALHQQMDIEWKGTVAYADTDAGAFEGRLEWNYTRKIGRLFWDIKDFDLSSLHGLTPKLSADALRGTFGSEGRLRIDKKQQFTGTHQTTLRDLKIAHSRLQAPLEIEQFRAAGDVDHHSLRHDDPEADDAPNNPSFVLKEQQLRMGDARAVLQIELVNFTPFDAPRTDAVYVDLDVPPQPAMKLFDAMPESLRGPLQGTEMEGSWGLRVAFDVERSSETEAGHALWNIRAPRIYNVHDKDLRLVSLPEAVDVRRLNGAMEFVFRGPEDRFMRTLKIPSPQAIKKLREARQAEEDTTAPHDDTPARAKKSISDAHVWTPLQDMSFYLLATQLYREDGSFFKNTGINWLQIRRVLSDALTHHRVQRGASTITMQTVKNLFLTHEKSAERKIQELFLTYWMTRSVPKDRIFEVYMNVIELCPECNGVEEASRFHFDRPSKDLDIREAVWLSAISPNPSSRGGVKPKESVGFDECPRCDQILRGLHARGWINTQEFEDGTVAPIESPLPDPDDALRDGWFFAFEGEDDAAGDGLDHHAQNDALAQGSPASHGASIEDDAERKDDSEREDDAEHEDDAEREDDAPDPDAFEFLSLEERLAEWLQSQRPVRGAE